MNERQTAFFWGWVTACLIVIFLVQFFEHEQGRRFLKWVDELPEYKKEE